MTVTAEENGLTPELALLAAIEANDVPGVINWIKRGANVNQRGPLPYTVLMIAAGRGYVQITDLLLSAGADVHALDSTLGASALHKAAQSGVVEVARLLLEHGAFINLQSATVGHTPLIDAVWAKKPAMVKFLLDRGAAITIKTHYQGSVWDFIGKEARWTAGGTTPEKESWGSTIRELLERRQAQDEAALKAQPLMQAVLSNNLAEVKRLIAAGADVNELSPVLGSGNDGQTPLLVASFNGFSEIVKALTAAGANPRIIDYLLKATPAHKAAFSGHPEALQALVEQGLVDLNAQGPYNGYTALHDSVWHGHTQAMEVLLKAGVRTDLRGFDGNTAADLATALGYDAMAAAIRAKMQAA
jgi:ankyrin repeat protein